MNNTCMIVRLSKDADIRYSQGQKPTAIARFTVASDREFKQDGQPTADFYNCIAFGKTAEIIEKHASSKGSQVGLEGRFQNNNWTDKDGVKHFDLQFNVAKITFVGSKGGSSQSASQSNSDRDFMSIPDGIDGNLPFN